MADKLEREFQSKLIKELKMIFDGCIIIRPDPTRIQGIPDLLILYKNRWAALELKRSSDSKRRPNQDYYVDCMNGMSYASFIFPENKEEVLNELREVFGVKRNTRVSKSKQT